MLAAVTFAIPFYSGVDFLARTVKSILAQDDDSWDAVVCDDGAEAGVEDVVRAAGGGRVRYLRNPTNLGMAPNFNRCLDVATTDLVTVLHADDELMPSYCRTMRIAADRHPHAAAVFCRTHIIDEHGAPAFSLTDFAKELLLNPARTEELVLHGEPGVRALLRGNFIMAPTLCFRKTVLGARRFPEGFKFVMDWELTMKLLLDGDAIVGIPDRCYRYRRHGDNATAQYTRTQLRFREESAYYERMKVIAAERGWDACVRIATHKRMFRLNMAFHALKQAA
jgi:glycosyltransferase involved in cell wall biosynthesis